tara:strand:- start:404 stop:1090 length:687 start_codon:yes stop_codon:yes gene_type:complete
MRKIILYILVITQISFVAAQSLVVTGDNSVLNSDICLTTHSNLTVKNISNKEHVIACEKNVISQPAGMSNYFCWGGLCYGSNTIVSSEFLTLQSGQGDAVSFGGYFDAYCEQGIGVVEYCFYPIADTIDRTCFTVTYHGSATSVNDNPYYTNIGDFYPNPANDIVYFNFNGSLATLKLIDILGNNVKEILLSQKGVKKLDLSDMNKGIYFGNLIVNNEVVSIKKLIVK